MQNKLPRSTDSGLSQAEKSFDSLRTVSIVEPFVSRFHPHDKAPRANARESFSFKRLTSLASRFAFGNLHPLAKASGFKIGHYKSRSIFARNKTGWGRRVEGRVAGFLEKRGYKILERNLNVGFGEVDIVAIDGDELVFIEVKARGSDRFGLPEEAVSPRKLMRITRVAEFFAASHPELPRRMRIDVAAVEFKEGKVVKFRYYRNVS